LQSLSNRILDDSKNLHPLDLKEGWAEREKNAREAQKKRARLTFQARPQSSPSP
jgi:hypothetical protein